MDTFFIFGAKYLVFISPLIAGIYLLKLNKEKRSRVFIFFLISLPITFLLSLIARELYFNPRPFITGGFEPLIPHSGGNGFPSDHTLLASAIAFGITVFNRKLGLILFMIAAVVAASRVYVGVHHSVDVLASILIACSVSTITHLFLERKKSDTISS
jgi:undecaprenyl-diphosphatase